MNKSKFTNYNRKFFSLILVSFIFVSIVGIFMLLNKRSQTDNMNFAKGVLAINTDKSQYAPGEEVYIQMASLDANGNTLCDSNMELTITKLNSNNETMEQLNNVSISSSTTCNPANNVTNSPDYYAYFKPAEEGTYIIVLTDKDDENSTESEMVITVTANQDYTGTFTDAIPQSYSFAWYGNAKVDNNKISWNLDLKKGEIIELKYEYIPAGTENMTAAIGPIKSISNGKTIDLGNEWNLVLQ